MIHRALATGDISACGNKVTITVTCSAKDHETCSFATAHIATVIHLLIVVATDLGIDLTRPAHVVPFASGEARDKAQMDYFETMNGRPDNKG